MLTVYSDSPLRSPIQLMSVIFFFFLVETHQIINKEAENRITWIPIDLIEKVDSQTALGLTLIALPPPPQD